ncbi:MAG: D-aminoacyl-tRNA deacylase [Verrucomicrobiota bacterium]|jgi:D-tyrosyl-tRNA(Tyr) deacylase|nr:D-aminoacyl-tRNA deacylase [Verrucomicrobiota bacterium]MDP7048358.1 D-aminoacyl-tRNA deacylase [Verrucomicrobiota bacterium]
MRAVIQRASEASVTIDGQVHGRVGLGLVVLLGIEEADDATDIDWLCGKIARLRIFNDDNGLMNRSLTEVNGGVLLISQFTLHASTRKGNRPSFTRAASPDVAIPLYEQFIATLERALGQAVQVGEFGADMKVSLINDGPVTLTIDTKKRE